MRWDSLVVGCQLCEPDGSVDLLVRRNVNTFEIRREEDDRGRWKAHRLEGARADVHDFDQMLQNVGIVRQIDTDATRAGRIPGDVAARLAALRLLAES